MREHGRSCGVGLYGGPPSRGHTRSTGSLCLPAYRRPGPSPLAGATECECRCPPTECSTPLNYAPGGSVRHRTDPSPTRIYSGVMDLHRRHSMIIRDTLIAAALAVTLLTSAGCAVSRGQETTGAIHRRLRHHGGRENPDAGATRRVAGTSITVETHEGHRDAVRLREERGGEGCGRKHREERRRREGRQERDRRSPVSRRL